MNEQGLQGKVALVTGAGSSIGLGRAMAMALIRAGAKVAMVDVDAAAVGQTVADARVERGADCAMAVVADVTSAQDAERSVRAAIDGLGGLHIVINNAGISPRSPAGSSFWDLSVENWTRTIATNLSGPFQMARAAAPHLRAQGWGRIIGVTTSFDTMLRSAPYGPSKAGHEALVAVMARELEGSGVTANVLVPGGATVTNMTSHDPGRDTSGMLQPEVMQAPVVWLASEASNGFTGRRIIAQFWDEGLPLDQRLAKCSRAAGWPELGRQAAAARA